MAAETRRATRHEPVITTVSTPDGEVAFTATPLPWRLRNNVGEALIGSYNTALDQLIKGTRDENNNIVSLEGALFESILDYPALFALMYGELDTSGDEITISSVPAAQDKAFQMLDFDQMIEVLVGGLKANGLERMEHMLDPDRKKDLTTGENSPVSEIAPDGQKTESSTD